MKAQERCAHFHYKSYCMYRWLLSGRYWLEQLISSTRKRALSKNDKSMMHTSIVLWHNSDACVVIYSYVYKLFCTTCTVWKLILTTTISKIIVVLYNMYCSVKLLFSSL